jgi:hypothetical protein
MTGGLMQLVAYGAQDIYLTGNPMITYFKVVYRRHTNFAMESIQQTFSGTVGYNNKVSALISRNGDLVSGLTLEVDLPALDAATRWTDDVGHHLISEVSVEIGGQLIDRHYSDWLEIWAQLTVPASKQAGYREMIGQSPKDHLGRPNGLQCIGVAPAATRIYVPLQFWFCRNVGLSLPLIALQYHEVKVNITFQTAANLVMATANGAGTAPTTLAATLYADYIYLDTDERRRFAQVSHEYLIEQLQFNGDKSFDTLTCNADLTFNHPVKELVWVARYADATTARQWSNYSSVLANTLTNADIMPTSALAFTVGGTGASTMAIAAGTSATVLGTLVTDGTIVTAVAIVPGQVLVIANIAYFVVVGVAAGVNMNAANTLRVNNTTAVAAATRANVIAAVVNSSSSQFSRPQATSQQNFTRPTVVSATSISDVYASNPIVTAQLKLNGHDRFSVRDGEYFNRAQTLAHHTSVPSSPGINVYSFALKPEDHQPSGTCNFSRIDNARLNLTLNAGFDDATARTGTAIAGIVKIFAVNYNVLRIMSGMGGLAYSN